MELRVNDLVEICLNEEEASSASKIRKVFLDKEDLRYFRPETADWQNGEKGQYGGRLAGYKLVKHIKRPAPTPQRPGVLFRATIYLPGEDRVEEGVLLFSYGDNGGRLVAANEQPLRCYGGEWLGTTQVQPYFVMEVEEIIFEENI